MSRFSKTFRKMVFSINLFFALFIVSPVHACDADFSSVPGFKNNGPFLVKDIRKDSVNKSFIEIVIDDSGSIWHFIYRDGYEKRFKNGDTIYMKINDNNLISFFKKDANKNERGWVCCFEFAAGYKE